MNVASISKIQYTYSKLSGHFYATVLMILLILDSKGPNGGYYSTHHHLQPVSPR